MLVPNLMPRPSYLPLEHKILEHRRMLDSEGRLMWPQWSVKSSQFWDKSWTIF